MRPAIFDNRRSKQRAGRVSLRWIAGLLGVTIVVVTLLVFTTWFRPRQPAETDSRGSALPSVRYHPLPESRFLNTKSTAYVGSDACVGCHETEAEGYQQTGMARSADLVSAANEPAADVVEHSLSHRRYVIAHESDQVWHREYAWSNQDDEKGELLAEHVMKYRIGSGRHARTYLAEIDGFLVESPVSWFANQSHWAMSPGYDVPEQQGFERGVDQSCLRCHVGRSQAVENTLHRMQIIEASIGCERCHGPGEQHVKAHSSTDTVDLDSAVDWTIVNPKHLSRELSDNICGQCHFHAAVSLAFPHRSIDDYRPGLPLDQFRVDYQPEVADSRMTVVGHLDQLQQSKCYQQSEMSCVTCHNPHALPSTAEKFEYYRNICVSCHQPDHCRLSVSERSQSEPADNCMVCHMPQSATDIRHVAFTHHRIGIHSAESETRVHDQPGPLTLKTNAELSQLSGAERAGLLGMAYDEYAFEGGQEFAETYQQRGYRLLRQAWDQEKSQLGLVQIGRLAMLAAQRGDARALKHADSVLTQSQAPVNSQIEALLARANLRVAQGQLDQALADARRLTTLRRNWGDYLLVAMIEQKRGQTENAIEAYEKALTINNRLAEVRQMLIQYYQQTGNNARRRYHQKRL